MTGDSRTVVETHEEWAEDVGFFSDFAKEDSTTTSKRKRNREEHYRLSANSKDKSGEDELTRKLRADEARKQIAAKVLARASPREIEEARKKVRRETGNKEKAEELARSMTTEKNKFQSGKEKKRRHC